MSEKSAVDIIVEETVSAARKAVGEAKFDTSTYGVITEKAGKQYKVAAFGSEYRITSDHEYSVGQKVVVTALQKNFRNIVVSEGNTSVELLNVKSIVGQLGDDLEKLSDKADSEQKEAQSQINQTITTYYGEETPNLNNYPAKNWTTDEEKKKHEGDLYQNTRNSKCWRWITTETTWEWTQIVDSGLINSISTAVYAMNLAKTKSRVFTSTPTTPYDVGDVWAQGSTGDMYVCTRSKMEFTSYSSRDWVKATKYTDDTEALAAQKQVSDLSTTENTHYQELTESINTLRDSVSGTQGNIGGFTEIDYNLTKRQVNTNKNNITSLTTRTTNLEKSVANITADNFLAQLGLKVNSDGVLCYIYNS